MRQFYSAIALCVPLVACAEQSDITFEFALDDCNFKGALPTPNITGVLIITNHGGSTVSYDLPVEGGWEVRNSANQVVNERLASPTSSTGADCMTCPSTIDLRPGQPQFIPVTLTWDFTAPTDPSKVGDILAPTAPVTPDAYQVTVLLLGPDRSNSATVTVCAPVSAPDTRYGVCNTPCDLSATSCGATLGCTQ